MGRKNRRNIARYKVITKKTSHNYRSGVIQLIPNRDHIALFTEHKSDHLIIFVHGFNGSAVATWDEFLEQIITDNKISKYDIIFYDYPSLRYQASDHAALFYEFLKDNIFNIENYSYLKKALIASDQEIRNYKTVVIVAHSLGAIVVREALLMANFDQVNWLGKIKMALFAPAHHGAHVKKLIYEAMDFNFFTKILGAYSRYNAPVIKDLEPGSKILDKINTETLRLLSNGKGDFTKAKLVVHAAGDKIVENLRFNEDANPIVVVGQSHISVCKPNNLYDQPVKKLKTILK